MSVDKSHAEYGKMCGEQISEKFEVDSVSFKKYSNWRPKVEVRLIHPPEEHILKSVTQEQDGPGRNSKDSFRNHIHLGILQIALFKHPESGMPQICEWVNDGEEGLKQRFGLFLARKSSAMYPDAREAKDAEYKVEDRKDEFKQVSLPVLYKPRNSWHIKSHEDARQDTIQVTMREGDGEKFIKACKSASADADSKKTQEPWVVRTGPTGWEVFKNVVFALI